MPKLLANNLPTTISGEFGCENFGPDVPTEPAFIIPTGSTLPLPTYTDGQLMYIAVSGIIAITQNSIWLVKIANSSLVIG